MRNAHPGRIVGKRGRRLLAVLGLTVLAAEASGQDVIYSEFTSVPGGGPVVRRYEQYGYGKDAVVRYRGSTYGPGPQAIQDEHVRYGPAPVPGAFSAGLVGRYGPTPEGLFQGLGRGVSGQGQRRLDTVVPIGPAEVWPTSIFAGPYAPPLTIYQPTVPYSRGYNYTYGPDTETVVGTGEAIPPAPRAPAERPAPATSIQVSPAAPVQGSTTGPGGSQGTPPPPPVPYSPPTDEPIPTTPPPPPVPFVPAPPAPGLP